MNTRLPHAGLLFVLGISLLLSFLFSPPFGMIYNDIEIFQYCGRALLRGQIPYRDFFDHKPPLIYFINAAGLLIRPDRWGLWIIDTGFVLAITFWLYRLGKKHRLRFPWLVPLLFNLMIKDFEIAVEINLTREYSTFFVLFFFCVLMERSRYRYYLLGGLAALTFFIQQDQVLQLCPFLLYVLWTEKEPSVISRLSRLAAGFMIPTLLLVLFFAIHRSLDYFWEDAFRFNFKVYIREPKSWTDHFRTIKHVLHACEYEIPFLTALALGITSLFLQNKRKGLVIAALAALVLSMSSEYLGGRTQGTGVTQEITDYFLPLAGSVSILVFVVLAVTEDPILNSWKAQLPYAILLCANLSYTALNRSINLPLRARAPENNSPELRYLQQQHLQDYQFYAMLDGDYIFDYNKLNVLSPSRWIYHHFWQWYPQWDPDHRIMASIADDLLRHRTTYVILEPKAFTKMKNPVTRDWLYDFIVTHYQPVPTPGRDTSILWKWKDQAAGPGSTR